MPPLHPATQKAQLRSLLTTDLVVTSAQLQRWGLLRAAEWLALPRVTHTCRTRITQSDSDTDLTFVALDSEHLTRSPRDLMHLCGLAEARRHHQVAPGEVWQHVSLKGRTRGHQPDAEIVQHLDLARRSDWAVEFDTGYATARIAKKLEAAAQAGYTRLLWATTIHRRVQTVMRQATELQRQGRLPEVVWIETRFVNLWSPENPYGPRPRCHKAFILTRSFPAAAR